MPDEPDCQATWQLFRRTSRRTSITSPAGPTWPLKISRTIPRNRPGDNCRFR